MKKLLLIFPMILLSACASNQFAYPIERPTCEPAQIHKWCWEGGAEFVDIPASEQCPDGDMVWSVELEIDCFRKIELYRKQLEERVKHCTP